MQSNMEKTAAWAKIAEEESDPIERQAAASVAQVYATMVVADRLAVLTGITAAAGGVADQYAAQAPGWVGRTGWWGDGS